VNLVEIRRHLHAHPELGWAERGTTAFVAERLRECGLEPVLLSDGVGVICDIGPRAGRAMLLRADLDALPLADAKNVPYASTVPGVCHACGHDVHTAILLGAAERLASQPPDGHVRLLFQPAEEKMPGGALVALSEGVLDDVGMALALHCDPTVDVGQVGLREGAITAACDQLQIVLTGPGGHTSRPQNTVDLVYALGALITGLPGVLSRRVDPRSALSLVWGTATAGSVPNAIPHTATVAGTVRMLDHTAWERASELVIEGAQQLMVPYGASVEVRYRRGVPPVINDPAAHALLQESVAEALGPHASVLSKQSLGGEDFGWFGEKVPSAMARLGTRTPGGVTYDLHQPTFDVDEGCLQVGVDVLVTAARRYLAG